MATLTTVVREGVPAENATTNIVHRHTGQLMPENLEARDKETNRQVAGVGGEFWKVIHLERPDKDKPPTKIRLEPRVRTHCSRVAEFDLVPSTKYPGCFILNVCEQTLFLREFCRHGGHITGYSVMYCHKSQPEDDQYSWFFERTETVSPPLKYENLSKPLRQVLSTLGETVAHILIKDKLNTETKTRVLRFQVLHELKPGTQEPVNKSALITVLTTQGFLAPEKLGPLSREALLNAGNHPGLSDADVVESFLHEYGNVLETVVGSTVGTVAGVGAALKDICNRLGAVVRQILENSEHSALADLGNNTEYLSVLLRDLHLDAKDFIDDVSSLRSSWDNDRQALDIRIQTVFSSFAVVTGQVLKAKDSAASS